MALLWLIGLGLIIYLLSRGGNKTPVTFQPIESAEARLAKRNTEWIKFIAGYLEVVKSKSDKALIERMLADVEAQGLAVPEREFHTAQGLAVVEHAQLTITPHEAVTYDTISLSNEEPAETTQPKAELDNVSLLLYFGAFLFVASVGLFIVFGGANGTVRTFATLLVMGVLYGMGIWLFHNRSKLAQAGIAFSGIGMTIAPLVGVAAYNYLFGQTHGPAVWFVTSLMCMGMYVHALWVFRRPLVSYILIFTFLSLFESGVSIVSAPIYYFGWAMALVGIILVVASRLKGFWPELQESSRASSQVILPLSVLVSAVLVPAHGAGQLGVSLLFAAAYYGLEALSTDGQDRETNAVTSHITALASVVCLSYAAGHSWRVVAISLLAINIVQVLCLLLVPQKGALWRNFASVMMGTSLVGVITGLVSPGILLASVAILVPIGLIVWKRQQRMEGYVLGVPAWMAMPLVFGQVFLPVRLNAAAQATLLLSVLLVQLGVYLWQKPKANNPFWDTSAAQLYVLSSAVTIVSALFASAWICLVLCVGIIAALVLLAEHETEADWAVIAGFMAVAPVLRGLDTSGVLVTATLFALLLNIALALRYRKEANRWFSTLLWLGLPLSLGSGVVGGHWSATGYAWAYFAAMLGLILSRVIARGGLLVSANVPLASYAKTASYSYVVGYWLAAITAVSIALVSSNARLHATLILSAVTCVVYILARYIEKQPDIMVLLPILVQGILLSAIRPALEENSMVLYLLASTVLAVACYFAPLAGTDNNESLNQTAATIKTQEGSLVAVFVTPASIFVVSQLLWPMPLGLLIAGLMVYMRVRYTSQSNRELAGAIMVAAVLWFLWFAGVREVQAYTHVIVATLGFYAYWRASRNETVQSDQYLMSMLAVATIPLGLQALSGQAGGLYGWWLLLEQIAFMLIGMAIKKRVVTLWGLYVAVGAVLYQLRGLGWAALTVLAVFLIGIAVYKLQRHSDKS